MSDLHNVGGTPAVLKYLLKNGIIDGDVLTVTSKTMAENLASVPDLDPTQVWFSRPITKFPKKDILRPLDNPIKPTGHIQILRGNLAPEGALKKIGVNFFNLQNSELIFFVQALWLRSLERKENHSEATRVSLMVKNICWKIFPF